MKLCPQCEFIYEDDQTCCDMDGTELVYSQTRPILFQENLLSSFPEPYEPASIPASRTAEFPASRSGAWHVRPAFAALAAVFLVVLLFVVFYARTHQARSENALGQKSVQSANQSAEPVTAAEAPAPDLASTSESSLTPSPDSSSSNDTTGTPSSLPIPSADSLNRGRLTNPVSARASATDSSGSVIVWLTNGSSIKADEAWEKREGVWYRQAGMVTFLKRSRVRGIQRRGSPVPRVKSVAINAVEKSRRPDNNAIAQNQPRAEKPEVVTPKKESKVSMFLKRTGQILKKPFKF